MLKLYVESEALIFPSLKRYAAALSKFINILRKIVYEVSAVRDTLKSLLHNKTQAKFVNLLRPILEDLSADIEILICILNEHMGLGSGFTIRILPAAVYLSLDSVIHAIFSPFYGSSNITSIGSLVSSDQNMTYSSPRLASSRFHEIDINGDFDKKDHRYVEHNSRDHKISFMLHRRNLYRKNLHTAEDGIFFGSSIGVEKAGHRDVDVERGGDKTSNTEVHLIIHFFLFS